VESVLEWLILGLLALGGLVWGLFKVFGRTAAEEVAKEVVAELSRDARLSRDLEQVRGTQRQEARITAYGALWAATKPLAVYETTPIDCEAMLCLTKRLSDWYFSEHGGLMLTSIAREFYFALQDVVIRVGTIDGWTAVRSTQPREDFSEYLRSFHPNHYWGVVTLFEELRDVDTRAWPPERMTPLAKEWQNIVKGLVTDENTWRDISPEVQFAILQQVSSTLRTVLTADIESRLR
jgi:hypothetical protein